MKERTIYEQIAERTDGGVYIGVVGPVRTGKSTFVKRFMEQLVLPNIENVYRRERAKDELPQSGSLTRSGTWWTERWARRRTARRAW